MADDPFRSPTIWDALLTIVVSALGWMLRRIVNELDDKAERRDVDRLERDFRERQSDSDERSRVRDVEHGRLLEMLAQWQRRYSRRDRDDDE